MNSGTNLSTVPIPLESALEWRIKKTKAKAKKQWRYRLGDWILGSGTNLYPSRSRAAARRAEDAQGTPTQSHISPSILVYGDKIEMMNLPHEPPSHATRLGFQLWGSVRHHPAENLNRLLGNWIHTVEFEGFVASNF